MKKLLTSLADIEIWFVGPAVFLGVLYQPVLPYAVGLGMAFWFVRWAATGRPTLPNPVNLPILFLLFPVILSIYASQVPQKSVPQVLQLLAGLLLFFSLVNWAKTPVRIVSLLWGLLVLALLLAAASLFVVDGFLKYRFLLLLVPDKMVTDLVGTVNPNVMAGILILLLAGMCAFLIFRWFYLRWFQIAGLLFSVSFIFVVLFLTQSRSALVGLVFALALLMLLRYRFGWVLVTLAFIMTFGIVLQLGPQQVWKVVSEETGGTGSLTQREGIWQDAGLIIAHYPLTGVGMGSFDEAVNALYPLASAPIRDDHAHNLFLQIAVGLGLPGLAAWLASWFTVLWMAWQLYRGKDSFYRALGAAMLCTQAALGVHGLLDAVTWDTRPAVVVWVLWGLTAAAWNLVKAGFNHETLEPLAKS